MEQQLAHMKHAINSDHVAFAAWRVLEAVRAALQLCDLQVKAPPSSKCRVRYVHRIHWGTSTCYEERKYCLGLLDFYPIGRQGMKLDFRQNRFALHALHACAPKLLWAKVAGLYSLDVTASLLELSLGAGKIWGAEMSSA